MVRNIPSKYTQKMLLQTLEQSTGSVGVDFVFLPVHVHSSRGKGYAFVNFTDPTGVIRIHAALHGLHWTKFDSGKVCEVVYARLQGRQELENTLGRNYGVDMLCQRYRKR